MKTYERDEAIVKACLEGGHSLSAIAREVGLSVSRVSRILARQVGEGGKRQDLTPFSEVIDIYVAAINAGKSEAEAKAAMLDQIMLEPPSLHMYQDKTKLQVIDVAPSGIKPASKAKAWSQEVAKAVNGVRVIPPGQAEMAYHFEIVQPQSQPDSTRCETVFDEAFRRYDNRER